MNIEKKVMHLLINDLLGHSVDLVDATDNGSFMFAEVQVAGHCIGELDLMALSQYRVCDLYRHLAPKVKLMKDNIAKLDGVE